MSKIITYLSCIVECGSDISNPGKLGVYYKIRETLGENISEYDKTIVIDNYDINSNISSFYDYCLNTVEEIEGVNGE